MEKKEQPLVSCIISVYNNQNTLLDAINSLILQTYRPIEIIIVDDASTDNSYLILQELADKNSNIILLRNEHNMGLAASLNRAIHISKGEYIARMDADDFSLANRISIQVEFLNKNKNIDVLGANAEFINPQGELLYISKMPNNQKQMEQLIPKQCIFIHPTVMLRRCFFERVGYYDERLRKKQDYELWARGIKSSHYHNLNDVVLRYRKIKVKSFKTDLYGFYVRILNARRGGYLFKGVYWAIIVISFNFLKKVTLFQRR